MAAEHDGEHARPATFTTARVTSGVILERALHRERLLRDGGEASLVDELLTEADTRAASLGAGMVRVVVGPDRARSHVDAGPSRRRAWQPGDPPLSLLVRPDPRAGEGLLKKTVDRRALSLLDEEARSLGADGVVLEGPDGALREGTWFSFVLHVDDEWCAPPVGEGVLFSTTRAAFARALALRGEGLVERRLTREDLRRADGALALSALLGASAIRRVGDVVLESSAPLVERLLVHSLSQS